MKESLFRRMIRRFLSGRISAREESALEKFDHRMIEQRREENQLSRHEVWNELDRSLIRNERQRVLRIWSGIAASFAGLITMAYLFFNDGGWWSTQDKPAPMEFVEQSAKNGQRVEITLADGTYVKLNSGSRISFPKSFQGEPLREVRLEGEGYFRVTRRPTQPFVVRSGPIRTEVLGTAFNIRATGDEYEVIVQEGQVRVSDSLERSQELIANQKVRSGEGGLTPYEADFAQEVGWIRNLLRFDNVGAEELLLGLEKWYGVRFQYEEGTLPEGRYVVTFDNQPFYAVKMKLSDLLCLEFSEAKDRNIQIAKKANCPM